LRHTSERLEFSAGYTYGRSLDESSNLGEEVNLNRNPRNGRSYFNTSQFSDTALSTPGTAERRFFLGTGAGQLRHGAAQGRGSIRIEVSSSSTPRIFVCTGRRFCGHNIGQVLLETQVRFAGEPIRIRINGSKKTVYFSLDALDFVLSSKVRNP